MIPKKAKDYITHTFKNGRVVCLTGSGVSYESGIPVFRGKGAFWETYDPQVYAHIDGLTALFKENPAHYIDFVCDFYSLLLKARPNHAHLALAVLEKTGLLQSIITQNIDDLHQEAGSRSVIELHGNAYRIRCPHCQNSFTLEKPRIMEMVQLFKDNQGDRPQLLKIFSRYFPRCKKCNDRYRIDIVFFGETLPQEGLLEAYRQLDTAETLLVVGTSLVVYPVASLPLYAKQKGAKIIEINSEPSSLSELSDYKIIGQAGVVLPEILNLLEA